MVIKSYTSPHIHICNTVLRDVSDRNHDKRSYLEDVQYKNIIFSQKRTELLQRKFINPLKIVYLKYKLFIIVIYDVLKPFIL